MGPPQSAFKVVASAGKKDGFEKPGLLVDLWQRGSIAKALKMGESTAVITRLKEHPEQLPSAIALLGKTDFTKRDKARKLFMKIVREESDQVFLKKVLVALGHGASKEYNEYANNQCGEILTVAISRQELRGDALTAFADALTSGNAKSMRVVLRELSAIVRHVISVPDGLREEVSRLTQGHDTYLKRMAETVLEGMPPKTV
ncbi:Uncharacterised protein [Candidatus Bilamarchaeum dharawalense]|uniref:Uncharacterized protein n=1 Tax=Candidatus Bilamarchaeum dharawalense TaxID=2885759 RepID=A0A5E4LSC6_9ARCH|nr:Uncharacterised protein [Candidatus Bilamarchaeum dharawalense]